VAASVFLHGKAVFLELCSVVPVLLTSLMKVKDMSVTYTDETNDRSLNSDAPYVPAYARSRQSRKSKGGLKTWMILAPIGVLTIGGIGAAMMMGGGEQSQTAEAEVATPAPLASQPLQRDVATAPMTTAATPAPVDVVPAPAPVARSVEPARESAPVRRSAPRAAATTTPRVEATPEPVLTGPQPYNGTPSAPASSAAPSPTSTLNRAPVVVTPAPVTPAPTSAPVIVVPPAG
jgi:hypothetical protein